MQYKSKGEKLEQIVYRTLDWKEIKEILIKNWMTHDGMWFFHCVTRCGIKNTNKINKAAVKSMAKIEINRIKKAFGFNKIQTFKQFQDLVRGIFEIVKADFMDFSYEYPMFNKFKFIMNRCFAYDGVKRLGYIEEYECGIFERLKGWFDELGISYRIKPKVKGCMMNDCGNCYRLFEFEFTE
ncbi:MAG: DUF6125 family protein [Candidatus Thorarchaeota archaeon]